jgi:hypothetical protein
MTDARQKLLDQYEMSASEFEIFARLATDRSEQKDYGRLSAQYRRLAAGFRRALAVYEAAVAKLTLH